MRPEVSEANAGPRLPQTPLLGLPNTQGLLIIPNLATTCNNWFISNHDLVTGGFRAASLASKNAQPQIMNNCSHPAGTVLESFMSI